MIFPIYQKTICRYDDPDHSPVLCVGLIKGLIGNSFACLFSGFLFTNNNQIRRRHIFNVSLFPCIVVWQAKMLPFQTPPSLISNVRLFRPGCLWRSRPRGCVCCSVFCSARLSSRTASKNIFKNPNNLISNSCVAPIASLPTRCPFCLLDPFLYPLHTRTPQNSPTPPFLLFPPSWCCA